MRKSGAGVCAIGDGLPSDPSNRRRQLCREHSHIHIRCRLCVRCPLEIPTRTSMSPLTCAATGVFLRVAAMPGHDRTELRRKAHRLGVGCSFAARRGEVSVRSSENGWALGPW